MIEEVRKKSLDAADTTKVSTAARNQIAQKSDDLGVMGVARQRVSVREGNYMAKILQLCFPRSESLVCHHIQVQEIVVFVHIVATQVP